MVAAILLNEIRITHGPHPSLDTDKRAVASNRNMIKVSYGNAMKIVELDYYKAKIEYTPETDMFRGEILGLNGGANFYGKNSVDLPKTLKNRYKSF